MKVESQHEMNTLWDTLKCPFCRILFRVDKKDLSSHNDYPFSCLSCQKIFWVSLGDQNEIEVFEAKPSKKISGEKICHNCFSILEKGLLECHQCGQSFYSTQWRKNAPYSSYRLRRAFENVLDSYSSKSAHLKFSKLCLQENNIPFATYCYGSLLKKRPEDQQARSMLNHFKSILFSHQTRSKSHPIFSYTEGWLHAIIFFLFVGSIIFVFSI